MPDSHIGEFTKASQNRISEINQTLLCIQAKTCATNCGAIARKVDNQDYSNIRFKDGGQRELWTLTSACRKLADWC
ncbi:hypothetical protein LSAT2_001681 [Lamellibrachia satsuma]|nr:hypothetical protein LSAT2_001681 [Lamellibrachia satsuma]